MSSLDTTKCLGNTLLRKSRVYLIPMLANPQMGFKVLDAFSGSWRIQLAWTIQAFDAWEKFVRKVLVAFVCWY